MATTLTKNLKLRVNSNLTADAKYNLERLDLLGSTFLVNTANQLNIRSQTDILIEPESADVDGSGVGGSVSIGTASHLLSNIDLWGSSVTVPVSMGLKDQSPGGSFYLRLKYNSTLNGLLEATSDRTLSVDMEGADRSLVLGGSLGVLGGDLTLNLTGTSSVTLPQSGTLSTIAGIETLTNKSMSGLNNTFMDIQYGSLNLTGSITNSDISSSAAIAYSKLALGGSIVNSDISNSAAITYNKLSLTGSLTDSDISASASIAYSKLNLASALVNSDISPTAAISYSKLSLSNSITNSDVANTAAIAYSKLSLSGSIQASDLAPSVIDEILPDQTGNAGKFLQTDGSTVSWVSGGVSGVASATDTWTTGTSKVFNHGLNSSDVVVSVRDNSNELIGVDVTVTNSNTITLTSSEAPTGTWRVVVHA